MEEKLEFVGDYSLLIFVYGESAHSTFPLLLVHYLCKHYINLDFAVVWTLHSLLFDLVWHFPVVFCQLQRLKVPVLCDFVTF